MVRVEVSKVNYITLEGVSFTPEELGLYREGYINMGLNISDEETGEYRVYKIELVEGFDDRYCVSAYYSGE